MPVDTDGAREDDEFRRDELALGVSETPASMASPAAAAAAVALELARGRNDMVLAYLSS